MMTDTTIDTVIFDLGGVLIDWNPAYLFRKVFEDEAEMQFFLSEVCSPAWNAEQDAGRPLSEATELLVREHPDYAAEIQAYYGRWTEMLRGPIEESVAILRDLHARNTHRLLALTNWSDETFPVAWERYDFLRLFEDILVSGREGMKKPEYRIYHLFVERYQVDPARTLFIDDVPANVVAAREVGLQAIHFQSPQQLREDLKQRHILA